MAAECVSSHRAFIVSVVGLSVRAFEEMAESCGIRKVVAVDLAYPVEEAAQKYPDLGHVL